MKHMRHTLLGAILAVVMIAAASAQTYKVTTPITPGVAVPDKVETSIGTLHLALK